ncbi:MAG: trypsin-like peptidase domain-containing protein [Hymenobacteraceae bacterium]|nr:trypsin-like peptidase domain-containing protein [Hymenobacteraceae bacterium]MDX5481457.1 trypsin-like peptidase domain-containing protein [Hymenobacteraceae bacterium]
MTTYRLTDKMNGMKSAVLVLLVALVSAALAIAGYRYVDNRNEGLALITQEHLAQYARQQIPSRSSAGNPDFVRAAALVTPAVVHVKTRYDGSGRSVYGMFGAYPTRGAGSGVLITHDGYIVTNNHVIENVAAIEVVLPDKRSFTAKLIGGDPSTDLALLKIDGKNFPVVPLGDSDKVQVGEWVLAVGYPFSLNSTVTAGIISAKSRSIGILNRQSQRYYSNATQIASSTAIESFIQTDAAINSGNSGGALVNAAGQLIGINAAIASQTGSYAGYGFAIPVNLMQKVVNDFRKYGKVRRGYMGVNFPVPAVEDQVLRARGVDPATVQGVYVLGVLPESGAAAAGLMEGDIIKSIDGVRVMSSTELSERIARYQPGDKVQLTYLRNNRLLKAEVTLTGEEDERENSSRSDLALNLQEKLGAGFAPLPESAKQKYGLETGVLVTGVISGGFFDVAGIPEGTIISTINGRDVSNLSDIDKALRASRSRLVRVVGIMPDGTGFVFSFPLGT